MLKFYLPFYYLVYSRLKTKIDFISWMIIWMVPQFILSYVYADITLGKFTLLFLLTQLIFNSLYEIGYIENDVSTTDKEENPTLRLSSEVYAYMKQNYHRVIYIRYAIVLLSLTVLYWLNGSFDIHLNIGNFILLLLVTRLFFYWHNSIRNKINLLTFSILAVTKYIFPFTLFVIDNKELFYLSLFSMTLFPLLRIIEHSTHKRYAFTTYAKLVGNHDKFRIIYYLFFLSLFAFCYVVLPSIFDDYQVIFLLLIYFLLYRVSSYLLLKRGLYKRDVLKSKDLFIKEEQ